MAKHKKTRLLDKVLGIASFVPLLFKAASDAASLVKQESIQAKRNLVLLVILLLLLTVLCTTTWFCILGLLFFGLLSLKVNLTLTLLMIFFLNLLLMVIVGLGIINIKKNLFFPECRRFLLNFKK